MDYTITITINDLKEVVCDAYAAGMSKSETVYEPINEWIRRGEIAVWCAIESIDFKRVEQAIQLGVIRKKNSTRGFVYNKHDVKKMFEAWQEQ